MSSVSVEDLENAILDADCTWHLFLDKNPDVPERIARVVEDILDRLQVAAGMSACRCYHCGHTGCFPMSEPCPECGCKWTEPEEEGGAYAEGD